MYFRVFTNKEPDDVSIIETPYGGRLMFVMPEGNMLYFHLKDKQLIRNKKRWSQVGRMIFKMTVFHDFTTVYLHSLNIL